MFVPPWFNKRLINVKKRRNKTYIKYRNDPNSIDNQMAYVSIDKEFNILNKFFYNSFIVSIESKLQFNS